MSSERRISTEALGITKAPMEEPLGSVALAACALTSAAMALPTPSRNRSGIMSAPGDIVVLFAAPI
jgi:hypothetical protein